ncbi:tetratricopeptide repeat protein [Luteimonas aestuarii]|uniref:Tetratricopeptide repeat protein n=1 Tax=Luteimonas aestuarii TaxID=453837 RepID=A0A4R5U3T4_9GAMM|nr:tetratricopeptide repeat protein [Luteimonas aestuarii]TDK28370.1 tetratricopeptide repeat protein [Luteimonas aestuarii]
MSAWLLAALLASAGPANTAPVDAAPPATTTALAGVATTTEELLAMPDELRQRFHDEVLSPSSLPSRRLDAMMRFLFDDSGLGMRYASEATHGVADAYRTRQANCLSFTLLAIALAREAGFEAHGQRHDRILSWRQQDSNLVLSNHVNAGIRVGHRHFTLDVASDSVIAQGPPLRMTDAELAALYHGNRAMEYVLDGDVSGALPHVARSLQLDPRSATLWNNAGVAHLRNGDLGAATSAYERAIALDPDHSGALFNLAQAYQRQGNDAAAQHLNARAQRVLERNPFHHFLQGHGAEGRGELEAAQSHYRRAIRLLPREHRFHFALARVQVGLGDRTGAVRALRRARALGGDIERLQYQSKLDVLQAQLGR